MRDYRLLFMYSPDDGAGAGGAGGDGVGAGASTDPTVTITEKELNERLQKYFQNGMTEREKRLLESTIPDAFKKRNLPFTENFEKSLDAISETLSKTTKDTDQRILDAEMRIKALSDENKSWADKYQTAEDEKTNYIINQELFRAVAQTAIDPSQVAILLRNAIKIDMLKDGTIKVYDKSGNTIYDPKTGNPLTVQEAATKFLNENPHLMKGANRGGQGGGERTGISDNLLSKDPHTYTQDEEKRVYEDFMAGKLNIGK